MQPIETIHEPRWAVFCDGVAVMHYLTERAARSNLKALRQADAALAEALSVGPWRVQTSRPGGKP